ncbi:MAG: hypothetical protein M1818_006596 [Claussenomyces sp. TS43310]|nr:MAG: hypothetical protein M1818_006596 [Claussenomyces sp. TS43310]
MHRYHGNDDEIDIQVMRHHRPSPVLYDDRPARPVYLSGRPGQMLEIAGRSRSRSHERRAPAPAAAAPAPVIINNIYNDRDDSEEDERAYPSAVALSPHRSRSRQRPSQSPPMRDQYRDPGYMSREDYELESTRKELKRYKLQEKREEEERLMKNEMELKRLREEKKAEEEERAYHPVVALSPHRSRSRQRPSQSPPMRDQYRDPGYMSQEDYELERTRKELERYKLQEKREEEERLMKKEMELKRLREEKKAEEDEKLLKKEMELKRLKEEKKAEEEKKRAKEEAERAVKEWQTKEAERQAKEKKEKEEREKEYRKRLEEDLKRSNLDEKQIAIVLNNKEEEKAAERPTYTRMARRYLSVETLNTYRIDYALDPVSIIFSAAAMKINTRQDPEYVLIKRWVPEYEQDALWRHTKEIRERRRAPPMVLAIEDKHHHSHGHKEVEYEIVRKERQKRSKSPGGLVTFFAGAKRA